MKKTIQTCYPLDEKEKAELRLAAIQAQLKGKAEVEALLEPAAEKSLPERKPEAKHAPQHAPAAGNLIMQPGGENTVSSVSEQKEKSTSAGGAAKIAVVVAAIVACVAIGIIAALIIKKKPEEFRQGSSEMLLEEVSLAETTTTEMTTIETTTTTTEITTTTETTPATTITESEAEATTTATHLDWKLENAVAMCLGEGNFSITACKKDGSILHDSNATIPYDFSDWHDIVKIVYSDGWYGDPVGMKSDGTCITFELDYETQKYHTVEIEDPEWRDIIDIQPGGFGLRKDGVILCRNSDTKIVCSNWSDIKKIYTNGFGGVFGLRSNGNVIFVPGNINNNGYKEANVDISNKIKEWKDIVSISASAFYVAGLKSDGTVVLAGDANYPVLDSGTLNEVAFDVSDWKSIIDIHCDDYYIAGLKADGTVLICGNEPQSDFPVSAWRDIVAIQGDSQLILGQKANGTIVMTKTIVGYAAPAAKIGIIQYDFSTVVSRWNLLQ